MNILNILKIGDTESEDFSFSSFLYLFFKRHALGFPCCSVENNIPVEQEMQVRSMGQKDPLEKEMPTQTSILAWGIS